MTNNLIKTSDIRLFIIKTIYKIIDQKYSI